MHAAMNNLDTGKTIARLRCQFSDLAVGTARHALLNPDSAYQLTR